MTRTLADVLRQREPLLNESHCAMIVHRRTQTQLSCDFPLPCWDLGQCTIAVVDQFGGDPFIEIKSKVADGLMAHLDLPEFDRVVGEYLRMRPEVSVDVEAHK